MASANCIPSFYDFGNINSLNLACSSQPRKLGRRPEPITPQFPWFEHQNSLKFSLGRQPQKLSRWHEPSPSLIPQSVVYKIFKFSRNRQPHKLGRRPKPTTPTLSTIIDHHRQVQICTLPPALQAWQEAWPTLSSSYSQYLIIAHRVKFARNRQTRKICTRPMPTTSPRWHDLWSPQSGSNIP